MGTSAEMGKHVNLWFVITRAYRGGGFGGEWGGGDGLLGGGALGVGCLVGGGGDWGWGCGRWGGGVGFVFPFLTV